MDKTVEYTLNTEQCVDVALHMYHEWEKAMQPPIFIYKSFPEWLEQVKTNAARTLENPEPKSNKEDI